MVTNGSDLMMTMLRLKLINSTKISLLRLICEKCENERLMEPLDVYLKNIKEGKDGGRSCSDRLVTRLNMIGQRQRVVLEEYKSKTDSIDIKYLGMPSLSKNFDCKGYHFNKEVRLIHLHSQMNAGRNLSHKKKANQLQGTTIACFFLPF